MNIIHNDTRNTLEVSHVSDLLWIKCVGPPLCEFNANTYVGSWISKGRRCPDHTHQNRKLDITQNTRPFGSICNLHLIDILDLLFLL